jgi:hypothetical protein
VSGPTHPNGRNESGGPGEAGLRRSAPGLSREGHPPRARGRINKHRRASRARRPPRRASRAAPSQPIVTGWRRPARGARSLSAAER